VLHLAARGWVVFAGVRKHADGEGLCAEAAGAGANVRPLMIDVASEDSVVVAAAGRLREEVGAGGLAGLVNNAGISVNGPIEVLTREDWRRQFEVNVFGQVAMTRAMLPLLRRYAEARAAAMDRAGRTPEPARIVMMSSIAGRLAQPVIGPYCASKFALEAVADSLRLELRGQGVGVSLVEPGAIQSEIWRKAQDEVAAGVMAHPAAGRYEGMVRSVARMAEKAAAGAIPAQRVAVVVERCLTARRAPARVLVGRDAKVGAWAKAVMPTRVFDAVLARVFGSGQGR
jgi:NAD(P)-dependent dehydrogenase (short-subunit alcohol dehydrogenase family)